MYFTRYGTQIRSATSTDHLGWTDEGIRLLTSLPPAVDSSNLTACSILPLSAGGLRMLYSVKSSTGIFAVMSATSTDGLTWFKEPGLRLIVNNGLAYVSSPKVMPALPGQWRMYFVQDLTSANNPTNYGVRSALSFNEGLTWTVDSGNRLSAPVGEISVSSLTDGRHRMFYTTALSGTTVYLEIRSALSSNGLAFTTETGTILSTSAASGSLGAPAVVRSTDTFRWRLLHSFSAAAGSVDPVALSALTPSPRLLGISPSTGEINQSAFGFTLTGEVFSTGPVVTISQGATTVAATGVSGTNDLSVTGILNLTNLPIGFWNVTIANSDGQASTFSNALFLDIPAGIVTVKDNLIRPRLSQKTQIDVTTFGQGRVTVKLYTLNGELVRTLLDEDRPAGPLTVFWPGDTSLGNVVASGVYLLHVSGPKTDQTRKIIVIK